MDTSRGKRPSLPPILDTSRLHLRPWALGDVDQVFDYARDPEWSRFLRMGELGYSVARLYWSQGYVTEAARAVIGAAFVTHPDLKRIRSMADAGNLPSQRVMEKVGMRREGVLRQNRIERGQPMDEVWYGLLRDEWEIGRGKESGGT